MSLRICCLFILLFFNLPSFAETAVLPRTKAPKGAKAYIISPKNGENLKSPVKVVFGLSGIGVAPAGVKNHKTGHHHLLIDSELKNYNLPIPSDSKHKHFGGGQTETSIDLPPGKHSLQLVLGDHLHMPHEPAIKSKKIYITVTK